MCGGVPRWAPDGGCVQEQATPGYHLSQLGHGAEISSLPMLITRVAERPQPGIGSGGVSWVGIGRSARFFQPSERPTS